MKTLIYDDLCPLCSCYSNLFVRCGLISAKGRVPFTSAGSETLSRIDPDRGRNEIPLVDNTTGQTWYGIDALLELLGQKATWIKVIGRWAPLYWVLKKFYKLVSYNRKVIVAKKCGTGQYDCSPDINIRYRVLFLFMSLVTATAILSVFHYEFLIENSWYRHSLAGIQAGHAAIVVVNVSLSLTLRRQQRLEFLGQVTMLALMASLLLIPLLIVDGFTTVPGWLTMTWLGLVAIFIFREYVRRMNYVGVLVSNPWIAGINLACMMGWVIFIVA